MSAARRTRWARWLKGHQHAPGIRQALDGVQRVYDWARAVAADPERPAQAGGWPVRLVPLPSPKPFSRPDRRRVLAALRAQNSSFFDGGSVQRFEAACARSFGARHAIAVSSGTAALHVALIAARIGPGDEVLVPASTYVSTAFAPLYQGARPRFVDVDPATACIDPAALQRALTPRTRAILVVHLCGVPCDMDAVNAFARERGLLVVEDAAQAHGSRYRGRSVGTLGDIGCFSFGSTKSLVTGEGGLVLTDDDGLARRARLAMSLAERSALGRPALDTQSWAPTDEPEYEMLGWNYRLGALQAAVGLAQLERLERIRELRARNARRLVERLEGLPEVLVQAAPQGSEPCLSTLLLRIDPRSGSRRRDALASALAHERIDHRLPLRPLPRHALFGEREHFPGAEEVYASGLGLRVDPALGPREIDACATAIRRALLWSNGPASRP